MTNVSFKDIVVGQYADYFDTGLWYMIDGRIVAPSDLTVPQLKDFLIASGGAVYLRKDCLASGRMMDNISRGEKPIVARSKKKAWRRNPYERPSYTHFSNGRTGVSYPKDYVQTNPRKK